ncbi:hypothetical protein XELAEV_18014860mg [Xenopus laevis]|uniref:Endonuclease/exonuclease/phosphatase domain-containing protein n=1 Tax=Xenopus laevis TaxID=8355 RepID=A0A974HVK1_XENLA|nr:hypothetical protein XELAEV_18014860mg [Xenopus laevis]
MTNPFKIVFHNTKGLNSPHKRTLAFNHYRKLHTNILFLQAPHFLSTYYPNFYLATTSSKTKGVAICFRKGFHFHPLKQILDSNGHFLILVGELQDIMITLVCYYGPNKQQHLFFHTLQETILGNQKGELILAGDTNLFLSSTLNHSKGSLATHIADQYCSKEY